MSFYRIATEDDFVKEEKRFEDLPAYVKESVDKEKRIDPKAFKTYREQYSLSIVEARRDFEAYLAFRLAHDDFQAGKDVFTSY